MTHSAFLTSLYDELRRRAYSRTMKTCIMETVEAALAKTELEPDEKRSGEGVENIVNNICRSMKVSKKDLRSPVRTAKLVIARQLICYLIRMEYGFLVSVTEIGDMLNRHHATVIFSVRKVRTSLKKGDEKMVHYYNVYKKYCDSVK